MNLFKAATKRFLNSALRRAPGLSILIRLAAKLPPSFKIAPLTRTMGVIASTLPNPIPVETNLGMNRRYRISSVSTQTNFVFGTPDQFKGERGALYLARILVEDCDCFVDVGANRGYFIFFVGDTVGNSFPIFFFEPNETLFRQLSKNIEANRRGAVKGFAVAIGASNGTARFHINLSDDSSSSLSDYFVNKHENKEVQVPVMTFSHFAEKQDIKNALLKVDIENAEFSFLSGAKSESSRIRYLIMEVLGPAVTQGFVVEAAKSLGMYAYYINDYCLEHSVAGEFTYHAPECNWLFCRLDPRELSQRLRGSPFFVKSSQGHTKAKAA